MFEIAAFLAGCQQNTHQPIASADRRMKESCHLFVNPDDQELDWGPQKPDQPVPQYYAQPATKAAKMRQIIHVEKPKNYGETRSKKELEKMKQSDSKRVDKGFGR